MPLATVLAFWAVAAVLIAVPGPDWAFAINAGLRRHIVAAAGGIVLGYVAMTLVVAGGLGVLIATTPAALAVLTVVGALYLVWLGVKIVRHPADITRPSDTSTSTPRRTLLQGVDVSGLNPKALLIFVASYRSSQKHGGSLAPAHPADRSRLRLHPHLWRLLPRPRRSRHPTAAPPTRRRTHRLPHIRHLDDSPRGRPRPGTVHHLAAPVKRRASPHSPLGGSASGTKL
ncbi:MAG: LysE family translocator [Actinomycetota bacterium]|nr:LysE family translocator [Actinomycetota bacterium]